MPRVLVSLGSNLGDRHATLDAAIAQIERIADGESLSLSERLDSAPVGGPAGQGAFVNMAAAFDTLLAPIQLLGALQTVEDTLDRRRPVRWGERSLDLDLLLYSDEVIRTDRLCVPHPRMTFRRFVLGPAREVASDWLHPECAATLGVLFAQLDSPSDDIAIVGDAGGAIARLVSTARPALRNAGGGPSRLTIDGGPEPHPLPPCGPRLVLADCPREHWEAEVLAALDCVWPARSDAS